MNVEPENGLDVPFSLSDVFCFHSERFGDFLSTTAWPKQVEQQSLGPGSWELSIRSGSHMFLVLL